MKAGWQDKPFEDCIRKVTYSPKIQRKDFLEAGAYPVISQEESFINGYWDNEADLFKISTPVVLFGDHTQALKYVDFDFVLGADGVKILQPNDFLVPRYFYYFLRSVELPDLGYARHYRLLGGLTVSYPSKDEQRRIVSILDEAFDGIATAKANAEKNLQNARALFKSYAESVFSSKDDTWRLVTLDQISENLDSKRVPITKSDREGGQYPYYGASGIVDYVKDFIFDGDTLLVSEDGANLLARSTPIAFSVSGKYWVNNHAHILKFEDMATQRYVEYYLESIKLDNFITGAAQPKLNQKALNSIPIPIPQSVKERKAVVDGLECMADECKKIESIFKRKLAALDELKQSLLHQAFSGAL